MNALVPTRPDISALEGLVLDTVPSQNSKRAYRRAVSDFMGWYRVRGTAGFVKASVNAWKADLESRGLSPSTINVRMVAVRRLAAEAADNGLMPAELAAGIGRIRGCRISGQRTGTWLTRDETESLLAAPSPSSLKGKRDRALLALLVGSGLRRCEAAALTFADIQQREGRWVLLDLVGKGGRIRTVPVPGWVKVSIDDWKKAAGLEHGRVFRAMNKAGQVVGAEITDQGIRDVVIQHSTKIGTRVAPHDLRRTFAKLAHRGHAALEQIQLSLGHASIQTTERYLGVKQDLSDAPCDRLGLSLA